MAVQIQIRRGTAAQWTATNPTLAEGELGLETDTSLMKIGDGDTPWTSLSYAVINGTVGDGFVTEVKLASNAVTESKIASNAVTNSKIANNAVGQTKLASGLSGITVCTSTTRPGSPFDGQAIYETDTDFVKVWNGSSWADVGPAAPSWTSFTPTWTNLTVGNGTVTAAYTTYGKTCTFYTIFTHGSTSSLGDVYMNFPVAPRDINAARGMALSATFNDVSVRVYPLGLDQANTDATKFRLVSFGTNNGVSGTLYNQAINFTAWASGDILYFGGTYGIA